MFRFDQMDPGIAARMSAELEHQAQCKLAMCERCGKYPAPAPPTKAELRDAWAKPALDTLPPAFRGVTLSSEWLGRLVGAHAIEQAREAVTASRAALIGPPGSGKTSLVVAMLQAAIDGETMHRWRKAEHRYVSAHALAKARAGHALGAGDPPLVAQALRCPLLVLDELGGENPLHASSVAEVIYERHAESLPTWITTGVTPSDIANRYGGGIARRIFEGAAVFRLGTPKR